MKLFLTLIVLHCFEQCYALDSLYTAKIDSIVFSIENTLQNSKSGYLVKEVEWYGWHEKYWIDTLHKNLMKTIVYRINIDSMFIPHSFDPGHQYAVDTSLEFYSYYYSNCRLIKTFDNVRQTNYYRCQDSSFFVKEKTGWEIINSSNHFMAKIFLFWSNRYIKHFRKLF